MTRIALVSIGSAGDIGVWSGIPFHVKAALEAMGVEVVDVSPLHVPAAALRYRAFVLAKRFGRNYRYDLDAAVISAFGRQAEQAIRAARVDAVMATSVLPVSAMDVGVPVAVWCDATIDNLAETYPELARLPAHQLRNGRAAERRAMQAASVLAYASPWAAASATGSFGADPARILPAPFGASLEPPAGFSATRAVAARDPSVCRLVWIGADWERKRGALCVQIARELMCRGVDVRLTLVGARPSGEALPAFAEHVGFVDKRTLRGRQQLSELLAGAHFVLLPSRAECFGIAIAEGNAHAVPCLAARVGGIPGAVIEGENGHLLAPDATAADYADRIVAWLRDPAAYGALAASSYATYEDRLNWTSSCTAILERLLPTVSR
ncbi:MAG: rfaG [Solirubrobacterales bacterium]|nr:rfaG [Solirubrobacterales bacterium]